MYQLKKYFFLLVLSVFLISGTSYSQQTFILYDENFNTGGATFQLNTGGVGSNTGNNTWIVNNLYNGLAVYPNTNTQNNTSSGTITLAPTSDYLHIHDIATVATGGANANYNPNAISDRFAYMRTGICTKGLTDVKLTFFNIIKTLGATYGELYYSINGGPWTLTSVGTFQNSGGNPPLWKYEVVTDPAFNNVQSLQFGFRWLNDNTTPPANSSSWGIDDIQIVGTYDPATNPVTINVRNLPASVCRGTNLFAQINLSDTLCNGSYSIQLSNSAGSFSSPAASWSTTINYPDTTGFIFINIPSSLPAATCYRLRVNRSSPLPQITGITSACFEIKNCPNTITTLQPAVTRDTCDVCINSAIDVPFWSTGVFTAGNVYTAQLSDATGSFANPFTIGTLNSTATFDPAVVPSPGSVSGTIPVVPPGCGYYVRVVSSNPATTGSVWGPFCIRECDIESNRMQDIRVCVTPTAGGVFTFTVDINKWNTLTNYGANNQFQIEVLDAQTLQQVDLAGLGFTISSNSGTFTLTVPNLAGLGALGLLPPKMWYIRILPTHALPPGCALGTIVRLIIGAPDPSPRIYVADTLYCLGTTARFYAIPGNPSSTYQWYFNNIALPSQYNRTSLGIILSTFGRHKIHFVENNNGCIGPPTATYINVIGTPGANITGPSPVCVGDTITYSVPFLAGTHYDWTLNPLGSVIDTGNNVVKILFTAPGTSTLSAYAVNKCGDNNGNKNILVNPRPSISATPDTAICAEESIVLKVNAGSATSFTWKDSAFVTIASMTDSITVFPQQTSKYYIQIKDANNCKNSDTILVEIMPLPTLEAGPDQIMCIGNSVYLNANGADNYLWTPSLGLSDSVIASPVADPTITTVYKLEGTTTFGCKKEDSLRVTVIRQDINNTQPVILCNGKSVTLQTPITGIIYSWNTSEVTQSITVSNAGTYVLTMTNPTDLCMISDTFHVVESDCSASIFVPNAFTPNDDNINDRFYVYVNGVSEFSLDIFDRWGNLLYHSNDPYEGWNGKYKGDLVQNDVYVWKVTFTGSIEGEYQAKKLIGRVTVVR